MSNPRTPESDHGPIIDPAHARALGNLSLSPQAGDYVGRGQHGELLYRGPGGQPMTADQLQQSQQALARQGQLRQQVAPEVEFGPVGSAAVERQRPGWQSEAAAARGAHESPTVPVSGKAINAYDDPYANEAAEDPLGQNKAAMRASQQQAEAAQSPQSASEMLRPKVAPYVEAPQQQPADWHGDRYAAGVPRHSQHPPY